MPVSSSFGLDPRPSKGLFSIVCFCSNLLTTHCWQMKEVEVEEGVEEEGGGTAAFAIVRQ